MTDTSIVHPRKDNSREQWDSLVDASDQAWLWHTWDSQDAIDTWPGKHDRSFSIVDPDQPDRLLAIMPVHRVDRPVARLFNNCILESIGGLAMAPNLTKRQLETVVKSWAERMMELARQENAELIDISLTPMAPAYRGEGCPRVNPLIEYGYQNTSTQTYVIKLGRPVEAIWDNLHSYCRTHIRKAEKSGLTVRPASGPQDLETYYDLHCSTYARTGVKPHPRAYFEMIWKCYVDTGKACVFFAELDGKVIAADNEAVFKKAVSGWTAAGINSVVPGVNNLLHWTAIQWAVENKNEFYESGEGFPGVKEGKRKGLTDFKKSFGGELYPFFRGQITRKNLLANIRRTFHSIRG